IEYFALHTAVGVLLLRSNVDTDQIIPAVYLKRVTRTGFEDALFAAWRGDDEFVLNQPAYSSGSVLVAGPDFGTGSSREHAVWALKDYGFRAVRSEEHTSELQSRGHLVCRLLLEKKETHRRTASA